jgi:hypothetical protein
MQGRSIWLLTATTVLSMLSAFAFERTAEACGGCFTAPPPPPPSPRPPSIVTDHRMVFSISKDQTTLYDELRYSGAPDSFAWVLPIVGTVKIGVSSDGLFSTLSAMTQVTVIPPPQNCPPRPASCPQPEFAAAPSAGASGGGGVTVTAQQTVGPYETVQLHSTDGKALTDWLTLHGYSIPDDIKPVVDKYVAEHFDFLALKLVPGTGVQAMRPVRVTTTGASAVLPLRMVAAGTGASVGIVLFTVAEGRYEPKNFPFFVIKAEELEWDWTTYSSNIATLRSDREKALGGRGWELESSVSFAHDQFVTGITNGYCQPYSGGYQGGYPGGFGGPAGGPAIASACSGAQNDYEAQDAGPNGVSLTKQQVQDEDVATLLTGIQGNVRITRTRADLSRQGLDQDLLLQASADQSNVDPARKVTKEKNQPICPIYQGCDQVGTAPRDEAAARSTAPGSSDGETFSCAMALGGERSHVVTALSLLAATALVISRVRRKKA